MLKKIFLLGLVSAMTVVLLSTTPVVYAGDGDNNFLLAFQDSPSDIIDSNTRDIVGGSDLDQDGKYEIIVTDYDNGGQVHVFEIIGDNTIEWVWSSPGTPSIDLVPAREVKTGDLDNDGVGEIILSISKNNAPIDSSGIYVYEWDGVNDNGYVFAAIIPIDLSLTSGYTEEFIVEDIDGDNINEAVFLNNGSDEEDNCYIISISGTFETVWTQIAEATFTRLGGDFNGPPYDVTSGDLDGDGLKEVIFSIWDFGGIFIVESPAPDTYIASNYIHIDTTGNDGVSLEGMAVADFNGDGSDELYVALYPSGQLVVVTGGTDVSTITFESNVRILRTEGVGVLGMAIGDQDHGTGSDGLDIYISEFGSEQEGGYIQNFEYTGSDIFDPSSYTEHVIFQDTEIFQPAGLFQIDAPPVDLDHDGKRELLVSYTGDSPNGIQIKVFEFDPLSPSLTVTSPNGGEVWEYGTVQNITWSSQNFIGGLKIDYSANGGSDWKEIISYTANDGNYDWTTPNDPSSNCLVRISKMAVGTPSDESDTPFTISVPPMAPITFILDDSQFQEITDCLLMGSWDSNGFYDSTWSSGAQQMYDDGTHGDLIAGDHKWSLQIDLVVDNGTNTWYWGASDGSSRQGVMDEPGPSFTLPDVSPQTLIYVREGYSTPCTGVSWTLDDLVANSGGIIAGSYPSYITQKTIVVCASDTLSIIAGSILKFDKGELRIFGTLRVQGTPENMVILTSNAAIPAPDDWWTLDFRPGSGGFMDYARIEYNHNGLWCYTGGPTHVIGCIFDNITNNGFYSYNISSIIFRKNTISNCGWKGIIMDNVATAEIDSNIIFNCVCDGMDIYNSSPNIRYNLIYNNNDEGITCGGSSANIINNTIHNNGLNPLPAGTHSSGISCSEFSNPVIKNNIITNNDYYGIISIGSAPQISYNDVWGHTISGYSGCSAGTGDISEDPRYVDPGSANFQLQSNSPCIDTGDPASPPDPDGTRADMGAYYFDQGQMVNVVIPDTTGQPNTWIGIPVNVMTDITGMGILAAEICLSWDPAVLDSVSVVPGLIIPSGWLFSYMYVPGSGQMCIWIAGTEGTPPTDPLAGIGSLVMLTFKVVGQHCDTTTIHFDKMVFNEGDPPAVTNDGLFHAFTGWDISGNIYYLNYNTGDTLAVDDAIVAAVNTPHKDTTDVTGGYRLLDLPPGDYVIKPGKENDLGVPSAISAFDAAWILQYGVGLRTFTPYQMIAGDVTGNGNVSAYDAAKILQYGVGLINKFSVMPDSIHFWRFVPEDFPITQANWNTAPDSIAYTPLNSDTTDNYVGIIYGDVSGNWQPTKWELAKSVIATVDIRLEQLTGKPGDKILLPICIDDAPAIIAMNFTLEYDPQVLKAVGPSLTSLTQGYLIAHNIEEGRIRVALAGSKPIVGSGVVANLEFEVLDTESPGAGSLLEITELVINDGSIVANIQAARFEMGSAVPDEYALQQNYPNPFNPETVIKYQLPKPGKVVLKIYNSIGQEIRTLVDKEKEAGYHEIRWDGKDDRGTMACSGVYIYRIQSGEFVKVQKMLFLR